MIKKPRSIPDNAGHKEEEQVWYIVGSRQTTPQASFRPVNASKQFRMPSDVNSSHPTQKPSMAHPAGVVDITSKSYFHRLLHQKYDPPVEEAFPARETSHMTDPGESRPSTSTMDIEERSFPEGEEGERAGRRSSRAGRTSIRRQEPAVEDESQTPLPSDKPSYATAETRDSAHSKASAASAGMPPQTFPMEEDRISPVELCKMIKKKTGRVNPDLKQMICSASGSIHAIRKSKLGLVDELPRDFIRYQAQ
eukprot:CAMPEP_0198200090 /NCGR_PEP_ID=MMETSP1445-20131203/3160_1 /TAXON_ID=36898 /ORGANISM="Pyramimonas sp., Strain CCMP2087" /LENGTH=250 /DNA_ID=CAMNT_0043870047 /DNA_START=657 /DNA_END=1409 /DNA_ORIENTATION=-